MAYPDSDPSWTGYPDTAQERSTKITEDGISRADRTSDGDFRVTFPSSIEGVRISVVHFPLSRSQVDAVLSFYNSNKGLEFPFIYHGNGDQFTCAFIKRPQEEWVGPGIDGSGVWKLTSSLIGNRV